MVMIIVRKKETESHEPRHGDVVLHAFVELFKIYKLNLSASSVSSVHYKRDAVKAWMRLKLQTVASPHTMGVSAL